MAASYYRLKYCGLPADKSSMSKTLAISFCLFCMFITGCAQSKPPYDFGVASGTAPGPTVKAIVLPSSCTLSGQAPHAFAQWGVFDADLYDCPVYAKMACTVAVTLDMAHSDMLCEPINASDPEGPPSECGASHISGWHYFGSVQTYAAAYDCGVKFTALRCFYSVHAPTLADNVYREDVKCVDNQLPID